MSTMSVFFGRRLSLIPVIVCRRNPGYRHFSTEDGDDKVLEIKKTNQEVKLNKDDYLPKERPWEGPKPPSEYLNFPEQPYWNTKLFEVTVNEDMSHVDWEQVPTGFRRYKYPQFFMGRSPFFRHKPIYPMGRQNPIESIVNNPSEEDKYYPRFADVLIIGGGIMGASVAYGLKKWARDAIPHVIVVEKDHTYKAASTTLSVGGLRQQFSLKENVQMSLWTSKFLRNAKHELSFLDIEPPDFAFNSGGYLLLANDEKAEKLLDNHVTQTECGAYVDILNSHQLKGKFPWLNTDDVLIGAHGVQNEGWFDPWSLLVALKGKAEFLGARFVRGELIDFNLRTDYLSTGLADDTGHGLQYAQEAIVRLDNGLERQITFSRAIIACGHNSGEVTKMLNIGTPNSRGIRSVPLPVEKRKRFVYVFNCPDGPGVDFPFLVDYSGVYCRREGMGGNFICGKCPSPDQEPDASNLDDIDYDFFENEIWPVLANRVKAFEKIKIVGAWAGYYDYNYFDQNGIVGVHPYYPNVTWITGFSGHGIQMGPAVGHAVAHVITEERYPENLDLTRLGWERILANKPLLESNIF